MPPRRAEKSSLKRGRSATEEESLDQKKPRRSERLSGQAQKKAGEATAQEARFEKPEKPASAPKTNKNTPISKTYLPSPLTHTECSANELYKEGTITPPEGRPSQIHHKRNASSSSGKAVEPSSPPSDTQPYSQFVPPSQSLSYEVEDEEGQGVWGYLIPLDDKCGDALVLKKRDVCSKSSSLDAAESSNPKKDEEEYEEKKARKGVPSGGYLIGRHRECDRILNIGTVSNRHCLIFSENKGGGYVAVLEDLSSNGTFVNEAIIGRNNRRELEDGDEITLIDEARFLFRYPKNRQSSAFRQQYKVLEQLGKGHFATVFLCVERSTGERFAVKKFEKRPAENERSKTEGLQQEIGILMGVSHPNVLCLKDTFDEADAVYLVLELAPEGELFNWIVRKGKLTEADTRKLFVQLFQGIKYLHDRNIVHRDVKPENILLMDKDLSIKLADFGLAKIIGEESFTTTLCGTPSYVAPEVLESSRQRKYTKAVDIWSLGVVLYICLCGFPPFSDELYTTDNPYTLSQQIKLGVFEYPSPYWDTVGDPALDLIDRMLVVNVDERYTIDECLEHPWITEKYKNINPTDSTDGLTGAFDNLDFSKRKPHRERTLLSSINTVKLDKVVKGNDDVPVNIFEKNPEGKRMANAVSASKSPKEVLQPKEAGPAEERDPEVFMHMGGKGDEPLFGNTKARRYTAAEVPR